MKNDFHKKAFLNKDGYHGVAAISIKITLPKGKSKYIEGGEIEISDCSRVVTLSLDISSKEEIDNSLHKLMVLSSTCTEAYNYLYKNKKFIIDKTKQDEKDNI